MLSHDDRVYASVYSALDRSLAPGGYDLLQAETPLGPEEDLDSAVKRAVVISLLCPDWED